MIFCFARSAVGAINENQIYYFLLIGNNFWYKYIKKLLLRSETAFIILSTVTMFIFFTTTTGTGLIPANLFFDLNRLRFLLVLSITMRLRQ